MIRRKKSWYPVLLPLSILAQAFLLYFVLAIPAMASYGQANDRLHRLYSSYLSPCCWRENLTVHESPIAEELRSKIALMVEEGQSDEQIEQALVGQYGKRILVLPEGQARVWLFWTPVVLLLAGALAVSLALKRMSRARLAAEGPIAELEAGWDRE